MLRAPCYERQAEKIKKRASKKRAMQPAPRSRLKKSKSASATHGKNRAVQNKEACSKKLLWPPGFEPGSPDSHLDALTI
jgi:hypothetical protein